MQSLLLVYSSGEGQTAKIAQHIAELARAALFQVELCDVARFPPNGTLTRFDGVMVGGSIHTGKHAPELVKFVGAHLDELKGKPTAFFSVSLSAAGDEEQREDAWRCLREFLDATGWVPARSTIMAGAVLYREYGFIKRMVMKQVMKSSGGDTDTSRDFEYTDWRQVETFAADFFQHVISESVAEEVLG